MAMMPARSIRPVTERSGPKPPPPAAPTVRAPDGAMPQVALYLGMAKASEEQLRDALILVAERHERNYELATGATTLSAWSTRHLEWIEPFAAAYGLLPSEGAETLRSAVLGGTRPGILGELQDLCDLAVLAERTEVVWTVLYQGARELRDPGLQELAGRARQHARRQIAWIRTEIDHLAPDAMAVPLDLSRQAMMSLPKRLAALASIPDSIWVPVVGAGLILAIGLIGLAVGRPWIGPSLGPTIMLAVMSPAHPTARAWNVLAGHLGGLSAGLAAVMMAGAQNAPIVLQTGELTAPRVAAATIAVGLTAAVGIILRASHPPAAATTLLVALGSIARPPQILATIAGVVIVALLAEWIRRIRLDRVTPAERRAPAASVARARIRGT
jgi:hypothetical protein